MKYADFLEISNFGGREPPNYEFYCAIFDTPKEKQEFLDYWHDLMPGLGSYPFASRDGRFYFCVPTGTIIPDNFCTLLEKAEVTQDTPE